MAKNTRVVATELYPFQVVAAYRAMQQNVVDEGDYKDHACSNEQAIVQGLGFEPETMPCSVSTPKAFGRWVSALGNEYRSLKESAGAWLTLDINGKTCYVSKLSIESRHMGKDFLPFVVGEADWTMAYEPLYVLSENNSKYGLTFHTTDEESVLELALEIKEISNCHTEIKKGSRVVAMVDQGKVMHLD